MPETQTGTAANAQGATSGTAAPATVQGAGAEVAARGQGSERRAEVSAFAERMLGKYGTLERALDAIAGENYDYREAARKDETTIANLSKNQIPAGAVVLTGDDVKHWEKVKATGVPLDKVEGTLKRAAELEKEKLANDKKAAHASVAKAAKMDHDVLSPLLDQFQLTAEIRKEKVAGPNGTVVDGEVAYVRAANDDKAAWEKLDAFVAKDGSPLKPFAVALKAKAGGTNGTSESSASSAAGSQGETTHAFTGNFGGDSVGNVGDDFITKRLERTNKAAGSRPNPLAPPAPATPAK